MANIFYDRKWGNRQALCRKQVYTWMRTNVSSGPTVRCINHADSPAISTYDIFVIALADVNRVVFV